MIIDGKVGIFSTKYGKVFSPAWSSLLLRPEAPTILSRVPMALWMLWTPASTLLMPQELSLVARMLLAAAAMLGLATSWRSVACTDLTALVASVSRSPTVVVAATEMLLILILSI